MIAQAKKYAQQKHEGQVRKIKGEDYFNHPHRVAQIVFKIKDSKELDSLMAAALLHDVVEDTNTPISEINEYFGELVASLVAELTSDKDGIETLGKKEYLASKMTTMSSWALIIKLSDRLDNLSDLDADNAKQSFRLRYVEETRYIISAVESLRPIVNRISRTHASLIQMIKDRLDVLDKVDA